MDPRTADLLKKYMIAGGSVGAGIGVGTSIANYLTYLHTKAKKQQADTSTDDDILYVDVPHTKQAGIADMPGVGGGIALAGGTLSLLAAHAVVKSIYNQVKKKQLQKDLDEAQQLYWNSASPPGTLDKSATVQPGKPMSTTETLASTPVALTLLAAVASGMITNKALSHYFPARDQTVDPVKASKPKQVKIRYVDDPETVKQASATDIEQAMDFAVSSLLYGLDKRSSFIPDLVASVASGGFTEFLDNLRAVGPYAALDLVKGASSAYQDPDQTYLAVCLLNRDPETAPIVATLLEAEIIDRLPYFHKVAYETEPEDREVVVKLAAAVSNDVAQGVVERKLGEDDGEPTDPDDDDDDLEENTDHEKSAPCCKKTGKGYQILCSMLEKDKTPPKIKKDDDVVDLAMAGA